MGDHSHQVVLKTKHFMLRKHLVIALPVPNAPNNAAQQNGRKACIDASTTDDKPVDSHHTCSDGCWDKTEDHA